MVGQVERSSSVGRPEAITAKYVANDYVIRLKYDLHGGSLVWGKNWAESILSCRSYLLSYWIQIIARHRLYCKKWNRGQFGRQLGLMHLAVVRVVRARKVTHTFMCRTAVCRAPYLPGEFSVNNNIYLLQLGCNPVAVVILHVYKIWNWLLINLSREGYMRSM